MVENKEDYGWCQEVFFSQVLARPKYFQPLSRNIQNYFQGAELFSKEIFRDFQKISLKEYFFFFTFIDFQSITSHCKATSVFNIGFTPPLFL